MSGPFRKTAMPHPNTTVKNEHKSISVTGISIGGGNSPLRNLTALLNHMNHNHHHHAPDVPGMIAHVTMPSALISISLRWMWLGKSRRKSHHDYQLIVEAAKRGDWRNPKISFHNVTLSRGGNMFYSIKELVEQADADPQGNVAELSDCDRISTNWSGTVLLPMERNLEVMKALSSSASVKQIRRLNGWRRAKSARHLKSGKAFHLTYHPISKPWNAIAVNANTMRRWAWSAPLQPQEVPAVQLLSLLPSKILTHPRRTARFPLCCWCLLDHHATMLYLRCWRRLSGREYLLVGECCSLDLLAAGGTSYQASCHCLVTKMLGLICIPSLVWSRLLSAQCHGASFCSSSRWYLGRYRAPRSSHDAMYCRSSLPTACETAWGGLAATPTGRRQREIFGVRFIYIY